MSRFTRIHFQSHSRKMVEIPVPEDQARASAAVSGDLPIKLWASRDFMATLYKDYPSTYPRLTIHRTETDRQTGTYRDGITWDELQRIKRECGFGNAWAVENFPSDDQVVGVQAIRHLWLLDQAPPFAWTEERERAARGLSTDPSEINPTPVNQPALRR